jgi:ABC-type uncharacterized transport system auxiliary subunit
MIRANHDFAMRTAATAPSRWKDRNVSTVARAAILLTAISAGFFSGCGAARPSKYYQLTVPGEMADAHTPDPAPVTLLIGNLLAPHLYREDRIVYSSGGEQMGTYEYQRWAEPPTEMIEGVLLRELRASGRYRAVYTHHSNVNGDFLLRGRLYEFKEVSGSSILAKVSFDLEMRDVKTGATVWTHYYTHDEPVNGKDVPAVVMALDKNVQQGIKEVVASLDQYFSSHPVK